MADTNIAQTLLTEAEVSKQLRVSLAALRKWRAINRGPQFLKIGSLVRYRQGDVDQWLASGPGWRRTPRYEWICRSLEWKWRRQVEDPGWRPTSRLMRAQGRA